MKENMMDPIYFPYIFDNSVGNNIKWDPSHRHDNAIEEK